MRLSRVFYIILIINILGCHSNKPQFTDPKIKYLNKTIKTKQSACVIGFDDFDNVTRLRIIGIKEERVFTFTHEQFAQYFVDKPFMDAYGSLARNNLNQYFFNIKFIIDTKYIKSGYNGFSQENMLRVTLVNGENIFLTNIYSSSGKIDKYSGNITYEGIFIIKKSDLKLLSKFEIDKIGVMWNGGFEEYSFFNLDIAKRHLNCLKYFKF